jgi:prophage regulatory protein
MIALKPMRVLNTAEVMDRTKYSRVHIWRLEQRNLFPKRVHLGDRRVAWVEDEIDEWLRLRVAARNV